ncbi:MAG: tetratricopeptide repeat protein [Gammaproteobacteria bacterium]|nr:tetratricopeptide repeat protein [Gammaproteobacteria bacterium]
MAEHLTEEEQVEAIKKWWKENGTAVVIGIVVGLAAVIGVHTWMNYQKSRAIKASDAYNQFTAALNKKDTADTDKLAQGMLDDYKGTSYAALTALQMAKQEVEANKLDAAATHVRWAMENPGHKTIGLIARQRLAEVLLAQDKLTEALAVLDQAKDPTFDPRFALVRGDILRKQGKLEQAREAYQLALTDPTLSGKEREFVEMKLDDMATPSLQENKK